MDAEYSASGPLLRPKSSLTMYYKEAWIHGVCGMYRHAVLSETNPLRPVCNDNSAITIDSLQTFSDRFQKTQDDYGLGSLTFVIQKK
jgi:hypothetical protein